MYLNLDIHIYIYIYYEYIYIYYKYIYIYIILYTIALHQPNPSKFAGSCDACISVSMANSPLLRGEPPLAANHWGFVWNTWIITMFWVSGWGWEFNLLCILPSNLPWSNDFGWFWFDQIIVLAISGLRNSCAPFQNCPGHHLFSDKPVSSQCSKELTEVDEKWLLRTSKQMKDHINSYRQDSPYKFCISIIHSPPKQVYICLMHVQATIGVSHGTAEFSNSWHLPSQSDSCRRMCICNIYIILYINTWLWTWSELAVQCTHKVLPFMPCK